MELAAEQIVAHDRGDDFDAVVVADRQDILLILGQDGEGVDEIDTGSLHLAVKNGFLPAPFRRLQFRPADMRNLVRGAVGAGRMDRLHTAGDEAESLRPAEFFAAVEHHLHADTDAEKRPGGHGERSDGLDQASLPQISDTCAERPHTRKHEPFRALHADGVIGQLHVGAGVLECLADAEEVARPVVDDGDTGHCTRRTCSPRACPPSRISCKVNLP